MAVEMAQIRIQYQYSTNSEYPVTNGNEWNFFKENNTRWVSVSVSTKVSVLLRC